MYPQLKNAIDLHVHAGPSVSKRKYSAYEALHRASEAGMGGIQLIDHLYNTTPVATLLNSMGLQSRAYGCIILNWAVGGLNPDVVNAALQMGTAQIQMPTYSAQSHIDRYGIDPVAFPYSMEGKTQGIRVMDEQGHLRKELEEILEVMEGKRAFLGTGHLSVQEIVVLGKRAAEKKIKVLVNSVSTDIIDMPLTEQQRLADDYIFFEHDHIVLTSIPHRPTPIESIVEQIKNLGASRCVLATDTGQMINKDLVTAMDEFISLLMKKGIGMDEIRLMVETNPKIVLGEI